MLFQEGWLPFMQYPLIHPCFRHSRNAIAFIGCWKHGFYSIRILGNRGNLDSAKDFKGFVVFILHELHDIYFTSTQLMAGTYTIHIP